MNPTGQYGPDYRLTLKQAQALWGRASRTWANNSHNNGYINPHNNGYINPHHITISAGHVRVGCQDIQRYELEQVALKLGWKFPIVKAAA